MSRQIDTRIERTPDGRRLVVARRTAASSEAVWRAFRDTERWPEWGPSVRAVDCSDRYVEAGSSGHVTTVGGLRLPFEVTTCANGRWTWDVARLPATGHRVEGPPTVAAFEVPLLAAPYAAVCRRALARLDRVSLAEERA
ncbi:MAG: SRPBCC family protein [Haloglomus sp.]